jgi:hypothetical protein
MNDAKAVGSAIFQTGGLTVARFPEAAGSGAEPCTLFVGFPKAALNGGRAAQSIHYG